MSWALVEVIVCVLGIAWLELGTVLSSLWALILEVISRLIICVVSLGVGETAFVEFGFSACALSVFCIAVCVVCYLWCNWSVG